MDRHRRHPADPDWHRDPTLLFVALPALALVACQLWGG